MGQCVMTKDVRGDAETFDPDAGASDRQTEAKRRLAAALRANLRRRKASRPLNDPAGGPATPGQGAQPVDDDQGAGGDIPAQYVPGGDRG